MNSLEFIALLIKIVGGTFLTIIIIGFYVALWTVTKEKIEKYQK